jgi:hypothetical protein
MRAKQNCSIIVSYLKHQFEPRHAEPVIMGCINKPPLKAIKPVCPAKFAKPASAKWFGEKRGQKTGMT